MINWEEDGFLYTKFPSGTIVKQPLQTKQLTQQEPQPTLEDITEETLLETKYQTVLLEMLL